jgi:hypothetical protein
MIRTLSLSILLAASLAAFGQAPTSPSPSTPKAAEKKAETGINFSQVLKTDDDKPMIDIDGKTQLTLLSVVEVALLANLPSDQGLSGQQKFDLYELMRKIKAGPQPVKLSEPDLTTLRDRVGKAFGPSIVGPAWKMLDPALK